MPLLRHRFEFEGYLPKKLALQVATLLFGRVAGAVLQALSLMVFARSAGVSEFGILATALGVAVVLQTAGDVGATTFVAKEIAENGLSPKAKGAERLSRFGTLSTSILGGLVLVALGVGSSPVYLQLLPLTVWLPLERATELRASASLATGDATIGMTCVAVRRALALAVLVGLIGLQLQPVLAYCLSAFVATGVTLAFFRSKLCSIDCAPQSVPGFRDAFKSCRPFWLHSLFVQSRNLDAPLVTMLLGPHTAAFFSLAARLMTPLRMVPSAIASALLPHLSRVNLSKHAEHRLLVIIAAGMTIPYLFLAWAAPFAIVHMLGARYAAAIVPTQIMIAALTLVSSASIFTAAIQARGRASTAARLTLIFSPAYLAAVVLGAMADGARGGAIGAALSMCFQMLALVVAYRRPARIDLGAVA